MTPFDSAIAVIDSYLSRFDPDWIQHARRDVDRMKVEIEVAASPVAGNDPVNIGLV